MALRHHQILPSFFTTLAHGRGHKHLVASSLVRDLSVDFRAQRLHLDLAKASIERDHKELSDGGGSTDGRNVRAKQDGVATVEVHEVIEMLCVAGESQVLGQFADGCLGAAERWTTRTERCAQPWDIAT